MQTVKQLKRRIAELEFDLAETDEKLQEYADTLAEIRGLSSLEDSGDDDSEDGEDSKKFNDLSEHAAIFVEYATSMLWAEGGLTGKEIQERVFTAWQSETGGTLQEFNSARAEVIEMAADRELLEKEVENGDTGA